MDVDDDNARLLALVTQAKQAIADNHSFLDLASPTQSQAIAQLQALTRQLNGVIRVLLADQR